MAQICGKHESTVGFAAMKKTADFDSVRSVCNEEVAIVCDAQRQFFFALKSFHVARARSGETMQGGENPPWHLVYPGGGHPPLRHPSTFAAPVHKDALHFVKCEMERYSEVPCSRKMIPVSRKLSKRVKFSQRARRARKWEPRYPLVFQFDASHLSLWPVGGWRAY
jgi:hypothetical protein